MTFTNINYMPHQLFFGREMRGSHCMRTYIYTSYADLRPSTRNLGGIYLTCARVIRLESAVCLNWILFRAQSAS